MNNPSLEPFFIWPKDKNGKSTRYCICVILRDGEMYQGTALCSEEDQFSKAEGRSISLARALAAYEKCLKARNTKKLPKNGKKVTVGHYSSICKGFPEDKSIYKLKTTKTLTESGATTLTKVELTPSSKDKKWTNYAHKEVKTAISENGNEVTITVNGKEQCLDYCGVHNLHMALTLWYRKTKEQQYKFKKVK